MEQDSAIIYKSLIDKFEKYNYSSIQYVPSRRSILLGQEKTVLTSFIFRKVPCIFNSSAFTPLYISLLRLTNRHRHLLFEIFFKGAKFAKDRLVNNIFTERDFDMFVARGFFQKCVKGYRSSYRFIPWDDLILIGRFDEGGKDYVHMGYDTITFYQNVKKDCAGAEMKERGLEIGCGNGFLSIFMAKSVKTIDAVDINPEAVRLTKINARLNDLHNINVFESDVYDNIKGRYDYIFSNPPFELLPEERKNMLHSFGGDYGLEITKRILEGLEEHLSEAGRAYILSNAYIRDLKENVLMEMIEKIFAHKNFDITLKELSYQLNPGSYRHYKLKGVEYSILYFITIRKSRLYKCKIIPLSFIQRIRERTRLHILRIIARCI